MKKIILIILLISGLLQAQSYTVEILKGFAQAQTCLTENWFNLKQGDVVGINTTVMINDNSIIQLKSIDTKFTLSGPAALQLANIKRMSTDDVLLALAMEDMINAPKNKKEEKSKNTAVYGTEENGKSMPSDISTGLGIKRLNGAMQLAASGYIGSAVITAEETFRKYPETYSFATYRIYFAKLLAELNLYQEAFDEYSSIKNLKLTLAENKEVDSKMDELKGKIAAK
jgi:hypothetical protein